MAKELSNYQKSVVSNYYNNLDTIMLNKLSGLVTQLYLAGAGKRAEHLWKRAEKSMLNLKIPPIIIEHIISERDVVILAKNLNDWLAKSKK